MLDVLNYSVRSRDGHYTVLQLIEVNHWSPNERHLQMKNDLGFWMQIAILQIVTDDVGCFLRARESSRVEVWGRVTLWCIQNTVFRTFCTKKPHRIQNWIRVTLMESEVNFFWAAYRWSRNRISDAVAFRWFSPTAKKDIGGTQWLIFRSNTPHFTRYTLNPTIRISFYELLDFESAKKKYDGSIAVACLYLNKNIVLAYHKMNMLGDNVTFFLEK